MALANTLLGTSETTIIQSSAGTSTAVLSLIFCNTSALAKTINVYAYPTGGSASTSSTIVSSLVIPALDSYVWTANEKFILASQDKISGYADVSGVVAVTSNYMVI